MSDHKPLKITTGVHPFEVLLLVAVLISGLSGVLFGRHSTTIETLFSEVAFIFSLGMVVSGAIGLAAMPLKVPINLYVERASMITLGTLLNGYGLAILIRYPEYQAPSAWIILAFGVAAYWRIFQITRDLRLLRKAIKDIHYIEDVIVADPRHDDDEES